MSGISFSGLSSGIDWDGIRQALMAVERQPLLRFSEKKSAFSLERAAFNDINTRLGSLKTEMSALLSQTTNLFTSKTAESSNVDVLTATAQSSATNGSYDIRVRTLALAESVISNASPSVASFTSSYAGPDLNPDIDPTTTLMGSLHRRDDGTSFVDADLGQITVRDAPGPVTTIDLAAGGITSASTFQDAINYINAELVADGSSATAALNATGDGIEFSSGTGNVELGDGGDGKSTATKLGVATVGLVAGPVDGGDLNPDLQGNTALSALNGGAGIADLASGIVLRDGLNSATIDLSTATTVNDVLAGINGAGLAVNATIGANGFQIASTVSNRSLAIEENGGTTATNLGLFGEDNVLRAKTSAEGSFTKVFLDGSQDGDNANLSMTDINNSINSLTGASFSSSIVDGRLIIKAGAVGTTNALEFKDNEAAGGILEQLDILIADGIDDSTVNNQYSGDNTQGGYLQAATNAEFSVDGLIVTRTQNTGITDVISGVTLDLNGISANTGGAFPTDYASSTLTVSSDDASLTDKIEKFISQYNSTIDFLTKNTATNPDGKDGTLAANSTARNLKDGLFSELSQLLPDDGRQFRSIFELRDADGNYAFEMDPDNASKIKFNRSAFEDVLSTDRAEVERLFREDTDGDNKYESGILGSLNTFVEGYNDSTDGVISQQIKTYDTQISDLEERMLKFSERLADKDAAFKRQFSAAEQLLSTLNAQANNFASQMSSFQ